MCRRLRMKYVMRRMVEVVLMWPWRPSSNLQLTATVNPDFGSVESDDDVVVNLTAYETFFPEKRLFFLEGNEVFVTTPRSVTNDELFPEVAEADNQPSAYRMEPSTLLNTRRIGGSAKQVVVPDNVDGQWRRARQTIGTYWCGKSGWSVRRFTIWVFDRL